MPIYEYECDDCGDTFTEKCSVDDRFVACWQPCLKCEGEIKLLISKTSFVLKGKGWFKDGY